jgi:hypothetical protein
VAAEIITTLGLTSDSISTAAKVGVAVGLVTTFISFIFDFAMLGVFLRFS